MPAFKELKSRVDPASQKLKNPTWKDLVARCKSNGKDLSAKSMYVTTCICVYV